MPEEYISFSKYAEKEVSSLLLISYFTTSSEPIILPILKLSQTKISFHDEEEITPGYVILSTTYAM